MFPGPLELLWILGILGILEILEILEILGRLGPLPHKKSPEIALKARKWRLPTLPQMQYHRRC